MTKHELRVQLDTILEQSDQALASIRTARRVMDAAAIAQRSAMESAFSAHDDALVSAITANRAALQLLNRVMDEGVEGAQP